MGSVNPEPVVLLESRDRRRDSASYSFTGLTEVITATTPDEVLPALKKIDRAVAAGLHAAGFISYEAAAGLDSGVPAPIPSMLPLLWFGLFRTRTAVAPRRRYAAHDCTTTDWWNSSSPDEHALAVERIRRYIAAGDVYQVNLTLQQSFSFTGAPMDLYRQLCRSQQAPFCAFLDLGRYKILSASPELFFRLKDGQLSVRPMKGTAPRGRWWEEDEAARETLRTSPKEQAENLMIVDLLRNDLGRVARTGSVRVESLFDVETLPTLHQLTSSISAHIEHGTAVSDVIHALFPSGSITGAPKKRAMEIIGELEESPRGVYTGCIGYMSPAPSAESPSCEAAFSVAIRTVVLDSHNGTGHIGVGSGITWDSRTGAEFAECLAKSAFVRHNRQEFSLIETMLLEEEAGWFLLDRHLERLRTSAAYFGFPLRTDLVQAALARRFTLPAAHRCKVRLLLSSRGSFTLQSEPISPETQEAALQIAFATTSVDSSNPFLYHKTTDRALYNGEKALRPDCGEIIFVNERGEVTEGTTTSIVARMAGDLVTPPLHCGLLPGVFRRELLEQGVIRERVIMQQELERCDEIHLINSVRKWRRAILV